ncbi:helix-turn-helix transcriptional regulator [Photobacterium damselae subsp. damselae]|uniref:Helix-turn-helix transcriptional regulator n=1 Tax=Photobacterium damselae subsp. damselae TaxID=85581 RepID=A0A850R0K0_PHODD|nr:helix-turn-helix transcriptional regulator [Photobacterium damselae subsp. damselae]
MFNHYLSQYREKHNLTQQDFVDILSNEFANLSKLDTVTLSRWENQKTLPPLKKQFQIFNYIDKLNAFINESPAQMFDHDSKIATYISKKFENSIAIISEITNSTESDYTILENDKNVDIDLFFENYFYDKNIEEKIFRENVKTISWVKKGQTHACLIYIDNVDNTNDDFHDSIIFAGLFAKTKNSFDKLFIFLYDYLCTVKNENIIIYSFDDNDHLLLKNLNGIQIQSKRISDNTIRCSFKFNRIDFLSNKHSFNYYKSMNNN